MVESLYIGLDGKEDDSVYGGVAMFCWTGHGSGFKILPSN